VSPTNAAPEINIFTNHQSSNENQKITNEAPAINKYTNRPIKINI